MPERITINLKPLLRPALDDRAQRAGVNLATYVNDVLAEHLGMAPESSGHLPLPAATSLPLVVVRLAPKDHPSDRWGWEPNMTPARYWEAAQGDWVVGKTARAACRYLAAADPYCIVRHVWRISGWVPAGERRWRAEGGVRLTTEAAAGPEVRMLTEVLDRQAPPARNPVRVLL